ncbi:membrane protein [Stackebrandtia albiflava]|uniref:Membrane protein n=1 Tax=Stackebrandtia albiflava TaxID=406432 RepID=A0A562VE22_9ACTN|nr:YihY/virulence factor BrkB family protein [Stackebrandtia albiflava]TWJ16115.1 membrane protein [Stackebrandtia albiflava]
MHTDRAPDPVHQPGSHAQDPPRKVRLRELAWPAVLRRTVTRFLAHDLLDWAAALTYYAVLSIFPGLLVLVSVLGMLGQDTTRALVDQITTLAPGAVGDILTDGIRNLQESRSSASLVAIVGVAAALWSASGYVGAFIRASNVVYGVPEGRPFWWVWPVRLALTVVSGVVLIVCSFLVVFTGRLAEALGRFIGAGGTFASVWDVAKWPVLVVLVSLILALLYWGAPNAVVGRFRIPSLGGLLAVVLWALASAGFALYVANFSSYNRTYGTLGGVIVFLVWLWISNIAVLLGAQFDAEVARGRAIVRGHPADVEPFTPLRSTAKKPAAGEAGGPATSREGANR